MGEAKTVVFPTQNSTMEGFLVRPDGEGNFPGIIIIHEIFGLNENIRG